MRALAVDDEDAAPAEPVRGDHEVAQLLRADLDGLAVQIERVLGAELAGAELGELRAADAGAARGVALAVALDDELALGRQLDDAHRRRRRRRNRQAIALVERTRAVDGGEK